MRYCLSQAQHPLKVLRLAQGEFMRLQTLWPTTEMLVKGDPVVQLVYVLQFSCTYVCPFTPSCQWMPS